MSKSYGKKGGKGDGKSYGGKPQENSYERGGYQSNEAWNWNYDKQPMKATVQVPSAEEFWQANEDQAKKYEIPGQKTNHPNWHKVRYPAHYGEVVKREEEQSASYHTVKVDRVKEHDMCEDMWNDAQNAFSDGEGDDDEEKSEVADIRAWQKTEHYQDMVKSLKFILSYNSRCDLYAAQSVAKEDMYEFMAEQIEHKSFLMEDFETLISQSGIFHMRNNANKNSRISFREEFMPKEKVVSYMEKEVRKEKKGEKLESYKLKADWRVGDEHVLGEIKDADSESARGESQKVPSIEEMEKGAKYRSEKVAIEFFNKAMDSILEEMTKKGENSVKPFQLKVSIGEHDRRDESGKRRGFARPNQWEVFAYADRQMTNEEFDNHRDTVTKFLARQLPVEHQHNVMEMYQMMRQEEEEGSNVFIGRVITSEKGNAAVRLYIEGRAAWKSEAEYSEKTKARLEENLGRIRGWVSDLQGLPVHEIQAQYLVQNSETRRYTKEIPLWTRVHIRIKVFADVKNWNGINFNVVDVGMWNLEDMTKIDCPKPELCYELGAYMNEYEEKASIEWMSQKTGVSQTPLPLPVMDKKVKRELKFKIPRYLFAGITKNELPNFHKHMEKITQNFSS